MWNISAPEPIGSFSIAYYRTDSEDPQDYVANVANERKAGDTSYVYSSGEFYLEIAAANCKWTVSVEEEKEKK